MVTPLLDNKRLRLQAAQFGMALTMRFVEHLNTAFIHRLCAVLLLSGEVRFISLFRMVGDD